MFLELYDGLGDAAFRHGLRNLYLTSAEDSTKWYGQGTCRGIDVGLCHLTAAFSDRHSSRTAWNCQRDHQSQVLRPSAVIRVAQLCNAQPSPSGTRRGTLAS